MMVWVDPRTSLAFSLNKHHTHGSLIRHHNHNIPVEKQSPCVLHFVVILCLKPQGNLGSCECARNATSTLKSPVTFRPRELSLALG